MTTQASTPPAAPSRSGTSLRILTQLWPWLFLIVLLIFFSIAGNAATGSNFLSVRNLSTILVTSTLVMLMAIGQTYVIITGGIDLSIGWTVGLASVVSARTMRDLGSSGLDPVIAIILGIIAGVLVALIPGLINGLLVARVKVPPFIATLGMFGIVRGAAFLLTDGQQVIGNIPQNIREILTSVGNGSLIYYINDIGFTFFNQPAGLTGQQARTLQKLAPYPVIVVAIAFIVFMFILSRTRFGRFTYAIGGNAEASRRAGINVDRHLIKIYLLAAFTAGIAGVIHVFRFTAGSPNAGEAQLLDSVAAVVIGGTSLFGGEGKFSGTLVGALIIAVLQFGLVFLAVEPLWQFIVVGIVIIIAVLVNQAQSAVAAEIGAQRMNTQPMLQVRHVSKYFGGLTALNDVSLEIHPGEVVALLGDNGAGKSTLIKCISGVYHPDEGEILFNGQPISSRTPAAVREMGIETIYQDLALAENLDVGANVFLGKEKTKRLFGLFPVTDDDYMRAEAEKVLERLDIHIPSLKQRLIRLSGGQRQAVAIARALYWNAKLVIMDEPTAALGVPEQRKVLDLVRSLRGHGIPVILISHTMSDVMECADRMLVMLRGRLVANVKREEATVDLLVKYIIGGADVIK